MTNEAFTKLLQRTARACNRYQQLLSRCNDEYLRRYGSRPNDIDDDYWIDSIEGGAGMASENFTAEDVDVGAVAAGCESYLYRPGEGRRRTE